MAHSKQMLRVLKARERVADRDRWFADVIYNIPIVENPEIRTMDTNGICIRFNPHFVDAEDCHIEGVFCHEGWHSILDHIRRRGTRDALDWNIAADAVVNPLVVRRGWSLPDRHIRIAEVENQEMSTERAYEYIKSKRKPPQQQPQEEEEEGEGGGVEEENEEEEDKWAETDIPEKTDIPEEEASSRMQEPTPQELEEFNQKLQRSIQSATEKAVKENRMSDDVARALQLDDVAVPPLNWREILQEMVETNRNDEARTWARPNRRYLGQGEIRPGYLRDQINNLIVMYDTSGSIRYDATVQMRKVTADLLANHTISSITMIGVDTYIRAIGEVSSPEEVMDFDLRVRGGGTNFYSAMERVGEIEDKIGVIFLTDMQTYSFGPDPMVPVVWVNWGSDVRPGHQYYPPYGRVVKYESEEAR